jgi:hypothetical protein
VTETDAEARAEAAAEAAVTAAVGSLTGWDELAITKVFGREFSDLGESTVMRALAFVLRRRRNDGDDTEAYNHAMGLTLNQVRSLFDEVSEPGED